MSGDVHYEAEDQEFGKYACVCGHPHYMECPGWLDSLSTDPCAYGQCCEPAVYQGFCRVHIEED
jgi:hypothetical protein